MTLIWWAIIDKPVSTVNGTSAPQQMLIWVRFNHQMTHKNIYIALNLNLMTFANRCKSPSPLETVHWRYLVTSLPAVRLFSAWPDLYAFFVFLIAPCADATSFAANVCAVSVPQSFWTLVSLSWNYQLNLMHLQYPLNQNGLNPVSLKIFHSWTTPA